MTAVDELIAFARAALDEDERVAREAVDQGGIGRGGEKHWHRLHDDRRSIIGDMSGNVVVHGIDEAWSPSSYQAEHIARWDPARVLDEVEAKRRVLDVILAYEAKIDGEWGCCHSADAIGAGRCPEIDPNEIHAIRVLAQPYAGREGWREEWRT